jgi:hypothetical protein
MVFNMSMVIAVPVFENPEIVTQFIKLNYELLTSYPLIVINKLGGEQLKELAIEYIESDCSFPEARKLSYNMCRTKYILNLDVDTVLPKGYVEDAIKLLESNPKIYAVSIDYEYPSNGHMAFGANIVRTEIIRQAYDWVKDGDIYCECLRMWAKFTGHVATLPYVAIHLKYRNV